MKLYDIFSNKTAVATAGLHDIPTQHQLADSSFGTLYRDEHTTAIRLRNHLRTRYARAIAAEYQMGDEFNFRHEFFHEDPEQQHTDENRNCSGPLYSLTLMRCYPDETVIVKEVPGSSLSLQTIPEHYIVETIKLGTKHREVRTYSTDELERLVESHPLRAGDYEERASKMQQIVSLYDLRTLHQRYNELQRFEGYTQRYNITFEQYGREVVAPKINGEIEFDAITKSLGKVLPNLIAVTAQKDASLLKDWLLTELKDPKNLPVISRSGLIANYASRQKIRDVKRMSTPAELASLGRSLFSSFFSRREPKWLAERANKLIACVPATLETNLSG